MLYGYLKDRKIIDRGDISVGTVVGQERIKYHCSPNSDSSHITAAICLNVFLPKQSE